jgi:hypothetical protein
MCKETHQTIGPSESSSVGPLLINLISLLHAFVAISGGNFPDIEVIHLRESEEKRM